MVHPVMALLPATSEWCIRLLERATKHTSHSCRNADASSAVREVSPTSPFPPSQTGQTYPFPFLHVSCLTLKDHLLDSWITVVRPQTWRRTFLLALRPSQRPAQIARACPTMKSYDVTLRDTLQKKRLLDRNMVRSPCRVSSTVLT